MTSDRHHTPKILALHKIRPGRRWDHTNIQPAQLERILDSLQNRGFQFAALDEVISQNTSKMVAITIDDGYAHLAETLPPICERFGLTPHLFIPAGEIGKMNRWDYTSLLSPEPHLNEAQIRKLSDFGVIIGSHGWFHRPMTNETQTELTDGLVNSKRRLEEITGRPVVAISYPFGRTSAKIESAALDAGYKLGLTTQWPKAGQTDTALGRVIIYGFDTPFSVLQKLEGKLARIEQVKQEVATFLSVGTGWYQRMSNRG
jgi:peptidoglycan/xylan/chitin deacetylase (PgdA/CDA1 family)